ncbi:MAG: TIGR03435 family protein [Bacteroidota bacterium]|nr:TIGR03435 family protein [Bacteroidota bacterium]
MKKTMLLTVTVLLALFTRAQVNIGQTIPEIKLPVLLNTGEKIDNLGALKGKVIWLEFWGTYCGPCVSAMPHLQQLQKQYAGKLQVIAISMEKERRINQFIANKPSNLWFAMDTADTFRKYFPYHTIPHAVLIDESGKVVAITEPSNITSKVIADVIAGRTINLPVKADNMTEDPIKTYFSAAASVQNRFLVQPEIKGLSSMSKTYVTDSVFKNRRLTMINLPLETIYRVAYKDLPYGRVIDLSPKENIKENKTMYCVDVIVAKRHEADLYPTLIKELQTKFDLKAGIEKRSKEVYILKIADPAKIKQLNPPSEKEETFAGSGGAFSGQNIKLRKVADYLEGFGLVQMPVVDETGSNTRYDIAFDYQSEKKGSLMEAIANLGLKLEKGKRDIDVLVFR